MMKFKLTCGSIHQAQEIEESLRKSYGLTGFDRHLSIIEIWFYRTSDVTWFQGILEFFKNRYRRDLTVEEWEF